MSATAPRPTDGGEVMASVDADEYVIADISEDEAWVSMCVQDAPDVRDWR
jgi:hypothetical protein